MTVIERPGSSKKARLLIAVIIVCFVSVVIGLLYVFYQGERRDARLALVESQSSSLSTALDKQREASVEAGIAPVVPDSSQINKDPSIIKIVGEPGPRGFQGESSFIPGPAGTPGLPGIQGIGGVDGKNGNDGVNGLNAAPALPGIDGKNGIDGQNGIDGKNGLDGRNGLDGLAGAPGPEGRSPTVVYCGLPDPITKVSTCTTTSPAPPPPPPAPPAPPAPPVP